MPVTGAREFGHKRRKQTEELVFQISTISITKQGSHKANITQAFHNFRINLKTLRIKKVQTFKLLYCFHSKEFKNKLISQVFFF